jgi:PIN domain nuclease of toxin-antitoxin system
MNILVDSCTFLWVTSDPGRLSERATTLLNDPDVPLFLSITTIWELTIKYRRKPHTLSEPPHMLFPKQCKHYSRSAVSRITPTHTLELF